MKLATAITLLSAASVPAIKEILQNSAKNNVINITNEICVGVGEYVLYGDDHATTDTFDLGQILSIEDVRDVSKKNLRESNIPPNKYKNARTRVALVREHETLSTISKLDRTKEENKLVPHRLKEAIPPPHADEF